MARPVHTLSSFFFYILGSSFFVAYLLYRNQVGAPWPVWWMKVADLPLIGFAFLYGGTSLYGSLKRGEGLSWILALIIGLPLVALFLFLCTLNFWDFLGLPQGSGL
ncbi:MAG: hypothetical protein PHS73_04985 [Candidatus Peribacteraceae bacterium]|nr:hypothetical protein [Candidatus Peribacteraceae bacterium]